MRFDAETGVYIYDCPICQDKKYVYQRKDDGRPDYSKVKKCICQTQQPQPQQLPLGDNNAT